jgi:Bacterial Ig domain
MLTLSSKSNKRSRKLIWYGLLIASLTIFAALGLSGCTIDDCGCDSDIDDVIEEFGRADDIDSSEADSVNTLKLWYRDLGFTYSFEWGGKVDACCNVSKETLDDNTDEDGDNLPDGDGDGDNLPDGDGDGDSPPDGDGDGDGDGDDDDDEVPDDSVPSAKDQDVTTLIDEELPITLEAEGGNGDALTYEIVDRPDRGNLTEPVGNRVDYEPDPGERYVETFTFKANDGETDSNIATVTVTVNARPVALDKDQTINTATDDSIEIKLDAIDLDGHFLIFDMVAEEGPENGDIKWSGIDTVEYRPTPGTGFTKDQFQFIATDTFKEESESATVTIRKSTVSAPTAFIVEKWQAEAIDLEEVKPTLEITLMAIDPEYNSEKPDPKYVPLEFKIISNETLEGGEIKDPDPEQIKIGVNTTVKTTYTPPEGYQGWDEFHFRVKNTMAHSDLAKVYVAVGNVAPVIVEPKQYITATIDKAVDGIDIELETIDPNGDDFEYSITSEPLMGTLGPINPETGIVRYTAKEGAEGVDKFVWEVKEVKDDPEDELTSQGTVYISIKPEPESEPES